MRFEMAVSQEMGGGTWRYPVRGPRVVLVCCPMCLNRSELRREVEADGEVVGGWRCAHPGCTFDRPVELAGWGG